MAGAGIAVGVFHRQHVAGMFESDRHFSHLSDMEREMTFRTEMVRLVQTLSHILVQGLYYSYYKTIVQADSLWTGVLAITNDNTTEFGHTINTLKRFNLYPEVFTAALYRAYSGYGKMFNVQLEQCFETNRGEGLPPIVSCEGARQ